MELNLSKFKQYTPVLLAGAFCLLVGFFVGNYQVNKEYQTLLDNYTSQHEHLTVEKNRNKSLSQTLRQAEEDQQELLDLIAELKDKPPEIKYIVKTVTVIEPSEPEYITPDVPA